VQRDDEYFEIEMFTAQQNVGCQGHALGGPLLLVDFIGLWQNSMPLILKTETQLFLL